jgi:hypothetical protein
MLSSAVVYGLEKIKKKQDQVKGPERGADRGAARLESRKSKYGFLFDGSLTCQL